MERGYKGAVDGKQGGCASGETACHRGGRREGVAGGVRGRFEGALGLVVGVGLGLF